jgi:hypothetical protein
MKDNIKKFAVLALVVFNIALAGGIVGAVEMHSYDTKTAGKTQSAVQAALKSIPVAQASSKN